MTRCPDLTPAELRVMKALWEIGTGSVAEVRAELQQRGNELAYTTVMTLLGRLAAKNAVLVDKAREPFVYRPAFRRERLVPGALEGCFRQRRAFGRAGPEFRDRLLAILVILPKVLHCVVIFHARDRR